MRELRQQLNLSQEKFAAHLHVSVRTVNRWENGHATPSPMALNLIEAKLQKFAGGNCLNSSQFQEDVTDKLRAMRRIIQC